VAVFSFSGLATGIDTGSIIDQLVAIRRRPLDLEIARRDERQATRDAFGEFQSKLLAVKTTLSNLRTSTDALDKSASSSDEDVLTATAGTGAADGVTSLTVTQLAAASRATATTGLSALDDAVASGGGTFAFTVGDGDTQSVALTASTSLQELIDDINALNAGVIASAVDVGTPGSSSYKLQVVAAATGTPSDVAVVTDNTNLGITAAPGANAQFTITGFPDTIERASNTVSDVISGVTLVLKSAGASADVTVSNDDGAIEAKVQAFVDAFNELQTFVNDNSDIERVDDETSSVGALAANPTIRGIMDRLRTDIRTSIEDTSGGVSTLSQVGIATQPDGTLRFDAATFQSELAAKPQGVAELFGGVGTDNGVADLLHNTITNLTQFSGLLDQVDNNFDAEIRRADESIANGERAIDAFRADLERTFAVLESTVNTIQSQGSFLLSQLTSVGASAPGNTRRDG
jgi:flagellar hook-associated protein 2